MYRRLISRAVAQLANPQKVPLDYPNPRRVGRRRNQQYDAKKVSAEVFRLPRFDFSAQNRGASGRQVFPQSALPP